MYPASDPAQVRMDHLAHDRREANIHDLAKALATAHDELAAAYAGTHADFNRAVEEIERLREQLDRANTERQRLAEELAEIRVWLDDELAEVAAELRRQDAKWGEQNHPDGTGWAFAGPIAGMLADLQRKTTERAAKAGQVTWRLILREEVAEASAESDPAKLRAELVQVAAVGVQWMKAIKRRVAAAQTGESRG